MIMIPLMMNSEDLSRPSSGQPERLSAFLLGGGSGQADIRQHPLVEILEATALRRAGKPVHEPSRHPRQHAAAGRSKRRPAEGLGHIDGGDSHSHCFFHDLAPTSSVIGVNPGAERRFSCLPMYEISASATNEIC
jgi:hypothetical protein